MDRIFRIGRVSKIDYATGMMSITYPDLDDAVTTLLSVVSFNDEWKPSQIGDEVAVLHFPNGQAKGLILGHYWNKDNVPAVIDTVYRKEYGTDQGECFAEYDGENLSFTDPEGTVKIADILDMAERLETAEQALNDHAAALRTANNTISGLATTLTQLSARVAALEGGG